MAASSVTASITKDERPLIGVGIMSGEPPKPVHALRGRVSRGAYGSGSKSAHEAVFIETEDQRLLLRRKLGPPMGDDELLQYLGQEVECDGHLQGSTLLADSIRRLG